MGATHFRTRAPRNVRAEMSPRVLACDIKRMIGILGPEPPVAAQYIPHRGIPLAAVPLAWNSSSNAGPREPRGRSHGRANLTPSPSVIAGTSTEPARAGIRPRCVDFSEKLR